MDTFHGMGMIASITNGHFSTKKIPRRKVLDGEILKKPHVPVVQFNEKSALLKGITFKTLEQKCLTKFYGDHLWSLSYYFKNPTPVWSDCMQMLHENHDEDQIKKDDVVPLPIIDLDPTNKICILRLPFRFLPT